MSMIGYINVSLETFGGTLSLIFILCLYLTRARKTKMERLFIRLLACNTALLFCDAAAWLFKGHGDSFSFWMVRISNFVVYFLGYVMLLLFTQYLVGFLQEKKIRVSKLPLNLMYGLMSGAVGLLILSQFNHMYYLIDSQNMYSRQDWFWLSQVLGILGMIINAGLLVYFRRHLQRNELIHFSIYISLPVTALLFQILFYNIAVLYLSTTICLLCIYISLQFNLYIEMGQKELELEKGRTAIMLSQIHPHFLYNALLGIKELCDTEPRRASEALEHFSYYLRGNLDSLSDIKLIPFKKELQHVQDYLYLEKMRFEERICIQWEIQYRDFLLPALTLQPVVENAIRYGITKIEKGGILTIRSEQIEDRVILTVRDNGAGFDISQRKADGRTHIGISNVRSRIEMLCNGKVIIKSAVGEGTEVKIILPQKEETAYENHSGR